AGDAFQNKFVIDTPIDGYGRPVVYLSLLRQVCSNGAVAHTPVFRSELALGRGEARVEYALVRALDGFNNEEGFGALRQRYEAAASRRSSATCWRTSTTWKGRAITSGIGRISSSPTTPRPARWRTCTGANSLGCPTTPANGNRGHEREATAPPARARGSCAGHR